MRILVVGGTGFIGWHAVCELFRRGFDVTAMARQAPVKGLFPKGVHSVQADIVTSSEEELRRVVNGHDALVHAAGADPRTLPGRSASDYFYQVNVAASVRLFRIARYEGVKRAVMITSYFHTLRPEMIESHPYVRSRALSEKKSLDAALPDLGLMILQPPYVFGVVPDQNTLGTGLARYAGSRLPLLVPEGGTNAMSVQGVATAIAGAIERGEPGKRYLVGDENLSWAELISRFARFKNRLRPVHIIPTRSINFAMHAGTIFLRIMHKESGLAPVPLTRILTDKMFFDPAPAAAALGFLRGDLDRAIKEVVDSS